MDLEIQTGTPLGDGICACYVDNPALPAFTERKLLMWFRGEWAYPMSDQKFRGRVYGWVALPVLKKEHFEPRIIVAKDAADFTEQYEREYDL